MLREYVFNEFLCNNNPWCTMIALSQLYDMLKIHITAEYGKITNERVTQYCIQHGIYDLGTLRRFRNAAVHNIVCMNKVCSTALRVDLVTVYTILEDLHIRYDKAVLISR